MLGSTQLNPSFEAKFVISTWSVLALRVYICTVEEYGYTSNSSSPSQPSITWRLIDSSWNCIKDERQAKCVCGEKINIKVAGGSLPRRQRLGIFHMQRVTFLSHATHISERKIQAKEVGAFLKWALEVFSLQTAVLRPSNVLLLPKQR